MKYHEALKMWNAHKKTINDQHVWALPKKGTPEHAEVVALQKGGKTPTAQRLEKATAKKRIGKALVKKVLEKRVAKANKERGEKALEGLRAVEAATKERNLARAAAAKPKPKPKPSYPTPYIYAGGQSWDDFGKLRFSQVPTNMDKDLWDDLKTMWKESKDAPGWPEITLEVEEDGQEWTFKKYGRIVMVVEKSYPASVHHILFGKIKDLLSSTYGIERVSEYIPSKPPPSKVEPEAPAPQPSLRRVLAEAGAVELGDLMGAIGVAAKHKMTASEFANMTIEKAREDARRARERGEDDTMDFTSYMLDMMERRRDRALAAAPSAAAAAPAPPRPHAFAAAEAKAAAAGGGAAAPAKAPVKSDYQLMKEAKAAKKKEAKKAGWTFGQEHRVNNQAEYETLINKMLEHGEIDKTLHQQALGRKYNFSFYYLIVKKAVKNLRVSIREKGT